MTKIYFAKLVSRRVIRRFIKITQLLAFVKTKFGFSVLAAVSFAV